MCKFQSVVVDADVANYSKLADQQKIVIDRLLADYIASIARYELIHIKKTGDGFLACTADCSDAGEVALKLRDSFRQYNWKRHGFDAPQSIRIGIHFGLIHLTANKSDVSGDVIVVANRIQTIAGLNEIFVSHSFKLNASAFADERFSFCDVGVRQLAKSYGQMQLFKLIWSTEDFLQTAPVKKATYMPLVLGRITDRERANFSKQSYQKIFTLFTEWAIRIQQDNPRVAVDIEKVSESIFIATLYLDDSIVESLKVWAGGLSSSEGVSCCLGKTTDKHETSSCNESLSVGVVEGALCLQSMMKSFFSSKGDDYDLSCMNIEQGAAYLWKMLTNSLLSRIR